MNKPTTAWRRTIWMSWSSLVLMGCFLGDFPQLLGAELALQYQTRGESWKEGVRPKPVSGLNIELISVLVDYQDTVQTAKFPNKVKLRFYLHQDHEAFITVRELDYRTYYWLDKVKLKKPWKVGFGNEFGWPAQPVLKGLRPPIQLYDLGALVRLEMEAPSAVEQVAPGVLYHTKLPTRIEGYVFTLKTGEDARLTATVIQEATGKKVNTQRFRKKRAGRPFTIRWKTEDADEGAYKLTVKGFSLTTNQTITKEIQFYHQPDLNP